MQNITQKKRISLINNDIRKFYPRNFIGFIYRKYSPFLKGLLVIGLLFIVYCLLFIVYCLLFIGLLVIGY